MLCAVSRRPSRQPHLEEVAVRPIVRILAHVAIAQALDLVLGIVDAAEEDDRDDVVRRTRRPPREQLGQEQQDGFLDEQAAVRVERPRLGAQLEEEVDLGRGGSVEDGRVDGDEGRLAPDRTGPDLGHADLERLGPGQADHLTLVHGLADERERDAQHVAAGLPYQGCSARSQTHDEDIAEVHFDARGHVRAIEWRLEPGDQQLIARLKPV